MSDKKVMVCSIPCWNDKTGSDTLSTLFSGYDIDKIANIYIRDGVPNSTACNRYFRISESLVVKSFFRRSMKTGSEVFSSEMNKVNDGLVSKAQVAGTNRYIKQFAREILWFFGKWKTKELNCFVDDFSPEVVFFPLEGYIHFNRICRYIVKRTGAKAIGYFWDDNFTYKQKKVFLHQILRFFQKRDLKKSVKLCSQFFAITPKTKNEADEVFDIKCKVLTKGIDFSHMQFTSYEVQEPIKILYTGKLIIGRLNTIALINDALERINTDKIKVELDIYTTTQLSDQQKNSLGSFVHILGAIPQSEVPEKQAKADILLFAESLTGEDKYVSRLSFSTKLTDYFRAGKCILAVAPAKTAPIEYLKANDAAICAESEDEIFSQLLILINHKQKIVEYGEKAFNCGEKYHNIQNIQKELFDTINNL